MPTEPASNAFAQAAQENILESMRLTVFVLKDDIPEILRMLVRWCGTLEHALYTEDCREMMTALRDRRDGDVNVGTFMDLLAQENRYARRLDVPSGGIDTILAVLDTIIHRNQLIGNCIQDYADQELIALHDKGIATTLDVRTALRHLRDTGNALEETTDALIAWQDDILNNDVDGDFGPFESTPAHSPRLKKALLERDVHILTLQQAFLQVCAAREDVARTCRTTVAVHAAFLNQAGVILLRSPAPGPDSPAP